MGVAGETTSVADKRTSQPKDAHDEIIARQQAIIPRKTIEAALGGCRHRTLNVCAGRNFACEPISGRTATVPAAAVVSPWKCIGALHALTEAKQAVVFRILVSSRLLHSRPAGI